MTLSNLTLPGRYANLYVKTESLVDAMKIFISNQTDGFRTTTSCGFILNSAFVARYHGGITQVLEAIIVLRKIPALSGHPEDSNLVNLHLYIHFFWYLQLKCKVLVSQKAFNELSYSE